MGQSVQGKCHTDLWSENSLGGLIKLKPNFYRRGKIKIGLTLEGGSVGISLLTKDLTKTMGKRYIVDPCVMGSFEVLVDDMSATGGLSITSAGKEKNQKSLTMHAIDMQSIVTFQTKSQDIWTNTELKSVSLDDLARKLGVPAPHLTKKTSYAL